MHDVTTHPPWNIKGGRKGYRGRFSEEKEVLSDWEPGIYLLFFVADCCFLFFAFLGFCCLGCTGVSVHVGSLRSPDRGPVASRPVVCVRW